MRCISCGVENPADASFCGECAAPLAGTLNCPSCGKANPAKQKFCNGCGRLLGGSTDRSASADPRTYTPKHLADKILTSCSALEGERKQVTVLFADLKGSMGLAEQVDAEEWHRIMDRFFAILGEGDPSVRGHDQPVHGRRDHGALRRADRPRGSCAEGLLRSTPSSEGASPLRGRAEAQKGRQFLGAHRPQLGRGCSREDRRRSQDGLHRAGPYRWPRRTNGADRRAGQDLCGRKDRGARAGFFQLRDLGTSELKGVSRPVRIYELEGTGPLRTAFEVRRARGLSRFVGRARWRAWRRPYPGRSKEAARSWASSRRRASARAGSATSSSSAVGRAA
jgi:hypothetical protein